MSAIYWVRNDLRTCDNLTLNQFCKNESSGAIIWSPTKSIERSGLNRQEFLIGNLNQFSEQLAAQQQKLLRTEHSFIRTLHTLLDGPSKMKIKKIYLSNEYAFDEVTEEQEVIRICNENKIEVISFDQNTLVNKKNLPFELSQMPLTFSKFRQLVEKNLQVEASVSAPEYWPSSFDFVDLKLMPSDTTNPSFAFKNLQDDCFSFYQYIKPGEMAGQRHLKDYLYKSHSLLTYKETRNGMLNWQDSSKLSLWLNCGALSARTVFNEIKKYEAQYQANESTYWLVFELLWRDYFKYFSKKYGKKIFLLKGVQSETIKVLQKNRNHFQSWCKGQTNSDFVNANMRELNLTGWMSNRGRQNVASFLIHDLALPWTWGAAYFETQLIDYDPDLNWGNWLYLSGQGSDPRSRIFNTQRQADLYDPEGLYQKKWLAKR
jgi:deoxyribodipyrimidine photo-lyase